MGNNVYKLTLDSQNKMVSSEVLLSGLIKPPMYLYVTDERVIYNSFLDNCLEVYTINGSHLWAYRGTGVMDMPHGFALDSWGRVIVADYLKQRVALESKDG